MCGLGLPLLLNKSKGSNKKQVKLSFPAKQPRQPFLGLGRPLLDDLHGAGELFARVLPEIVHLVGGVSPVAAELGFRAFGGVLGLRDLSQESRKSAQSKGAMWQEGLTAESIFCPA